MSFERKIEPDVGMHNTELVKAFNDAGKKGGPLLPIYHFNARALSLLLPKGGTVLDMGCGSAQFLIYLMKARPDVKAIGVDLSASMLRIAEANANRNNLKGRVQFIHEDIKNINFEVVKNVDAITSISALHHCPTATNLKEIFESFKKIEIHHKCAVWLFDLVRPKLEKTADLIPYTFEVSSGKKLSETFKKDWTVSLKAGWSFQEILNMLSTSNLLLKSSHSNYSQLHWAQGKVKKIVDDLWLAEPLSDYDLKNANRISNTLEF